MRVLFIGNSHTYYNDMPQMFAEICREKQKEVEVTMLAHGGKGWDFHVEEPEARFNILYGGYDAVVLQHTAHPMGDLEVMHESGKKLIEWVRQAGARPILYMTWTTKADGEQAQEKMGSAYRRLQQETGCELAPVGITESIRRKKCTRRTDSMRQRSAPGWRRLRLRRRF